MFAIMLCIANMIIYGEKVNVTIAQIAMAVEHKDGVRVEPQEGEVRFDWKNGEGQMMVSLYFAGYMLGMFMCGYFADR